MPGDDQSIAHNGNVLSLPIRVRALHLLTSAQIVGRYPVRAAHAHVHTATRDIDSEPEELVLHGQPATHGSMAPVLVSRRATESARARLHRARRHS